MGENSKIEWTSHTFNPWLGCAKVSPACANCYAEAWAKRSGLVEWGVGAERRRTSEAYWRQPLKWNREAAEAGERRRVFCASLADVFEDHPTIMPGWRADLGRLIQDTPNLDWLLLTKRPENVTRMLPDLWINFSKPYRMPQNVRLGVTTENQELFDKRFDALRRVSADGYFLSIEPLLGPIDLRLTVKFLGGSEAVKDIARKLWIIVGGESGPNARPIHPDWARSLRDQCQAVGVPFFFKQWGVWWPSNYQPRSPEWIAASRASTAGMSLTYNGNTASMFKVGKKTAGRLLDGREWNEFPEVSR